MICQICNREFNNNILFIGHLQFHSISLKEYYDLYLKKENEGVCQNCRKETKIINFNKGYRKFCSRKCSNIKNKDKIKKLI